jgi:hypothetical protein
LLELLQQVPLAFEDNPLAWKYGLDEQEAERRGNLLTNLVCNLRIEALVFNHFLSHVCPRHLVELVNGRRDGANQVVGHSADLENAIKDLARVELDGIRPLPAKTVEDLIDNAYLLGSTSNFA